MYVGTYTHIKPINHESRQLFVKGSLKSVNVFSTRKIIFMIEVIRWRKIIGKK